MTGQRVLITAGGGGIGRAMAEAFADAGWRVWVIDISADALADCPETWKSDVVDVRDPDSMRAFFRLLETEWNGLDALCANAGTAGPTELIEDQPPDGFRDCVATNLGGAFLAVRGALPMMKARRKGVALFTSSTAGIHGYPYRAPYSASKWALHGLMKTVAMEAGPFGIRANAIAPGCVEGPRMDAVIDREAAQKGATPEAVRRAYEEGSSMRGFVAARDIAAMAVFLASDAARFVSGQIIAVDGHTENPDPKFGRAR